MFPGNTGSYYYSYQTFQNCVLQNTYVLWDFNRLFTKKVCWHKVSNALSYFLFADSSCTSSSKFLRCWTVKTLVTSHLTSQLPNLFDYVMILCVCVCVFWREKMVVGTQTHLANFQRLLSWKYYIYYWKLLKYQYHLTE